MGSRYYDIDAILTDAQKVPCTFEISVPGLGYLDGNTNADMKKDSRVELPLWLAEMLAITQRLGTLDNVISIDLPSALGSRVQNALKANPTTVDLRSLAPHYYSLAERISNLLEEEELVEILSDTYKQRTAEIADHAVNPKGALGQGGDFLRGLEEGERGVFRAAHDSTKAMKAWRAERK